MDKKWRKAIFHGNTEGTLWFLVARKDDKAMFFYKYLVDNEEKLERCFRLILNPNQTLVVLEIC